MVKFICDISTSGRDRNMKISILMFGFLGIPAGYSFSRSKFKVMVKLICDISTSGRDRNMKMSILMFGFMGILAGYSFTR
jgi:hypothetical protein